MLRQGEAANLLFPRSTATTVKQFQEDQYQSLRVVRRGRSQGVLLQGISYLSLRQQASNYLLILCSTSNLTCPQLHGQTLSPKVYIPNKDGYLYTPTSLTSTRPERVRAEHSLEAVFTLSLLTVKENSH